MDGFCGELLLRGVAGALYAFVTRFSGAGMVSSLDMSFKILFMIIIGGVGSICGSFPVQHLSLLLPIFLDVAFAIFADLGLTFSSATVSHTSRLRCSVR